MRRSLLVIFLFFLPFNIYANSSIGADCLILEDENSIVCKYTHERVDYEKTVTFEWIDPNGELSRSREMSIPAMHGSVYDFRYIKGRSLGIWTFQVIDGEQKHTAKFTLK